LAQASGDARRRVSINGWAEALSNDRVRSSVVEGIEAPIALVTALVERAKREGRLSKEIEAETLGRAFVALFQGFNLQIAWGQAVEIETAVTVIERMIFGLFDRRDSPVQRTPGAP
jgi:hypothetical protein